MLWPFLALGSALIDASRNAFAKKISQLDEYVTGWATFAFGIPILLVLLPFGLADIQPGFWPAVVASSITNSIATVFYMSAIRRSDISLVVPLTSFMILTSTIVGWLVLGEAPSAPGLFGILLVFAGAYSLKLSRGVHFMEPIKRLVRDKGCLHMLFASGIWGLNASIDKIGVQASSPVVYLFTLSILVSIFLLPFIWKRKPLKEPSKLLALGSMNSALLVLFLSALQVAKVGYVVSLRSTAPLFSVLMGLLFFGEKHISRRFSAAAVMLAGIVLILL